MKHNLSPGFAGKLVLLMFFLPFFTVIHAQQKYIIKGKIEGLAKDMKLFLQFQSRNVVTGNVPSDSTIVKDGSFYLEGSINRPSRIYLSLRPLEPEPVPANGTLAFQAANARDGQAFYLCPGTTIINANSLKSAVIENQAQKEYAELQNQLKPVQDLMTAVDKRSFSNRNKDSIKVFQAERITIYRQFDSAKAVFVKKNPSSYVSLDLVIERYHVIEDTADFEAVFNSLSPSFKNSAEGKKIESALTLVKRFAIGQPAIVFTQNDTSGKPVSLASLKGKYVLIDFWASWCGPCRGEYPYLHKAYDQFKDKNFEIIGVSLDDNKSAWLGSIIENKFPWLEVCDLKGHLNDVVVAYGINAIPQSFLVNPQGIIIAKNLRGDNLIQKLNEVIKP